MIEMQSCPGGEECTVVCDFKFNQMLCMEVHLGPDGTRLSAQASVTCWPLKHADYMVYGTVL